MTDETENPRWNIVFSSADAVELAKVAEHLAAAEIPTRVIQADLDALDGDGDDDDDVPERDATEDAAEPDPADAGSLLHVVVSPDDAQEAAVEVGLYLAVSQSQEHAGRIDIFEELEVTVDDLLIAELSATGGPTYDLEDFDDLDEVRAWLDLLDAHDVRWTLSRQAHVVVHYNDEDKVDTIIEGMYADDDLGVGDVVRDPEVPRNADLPEPGPAAATPVSTVHDLDGRPAVDDLTSAAQPVVTKGSPLWLVGVALVALLVVFIIFVA